MKRCHYSSEKLKLAIPVAANLPRAWLDAMKRCDRIATHPQSFPELTGHDIAPRERIRARRPERMRAVGLVAMALLRRADRRTLRVGDQRNDGLCTGITVAELALHTGLCPRCVSRALAEGEGKYWTSVQPVVELPPGSRRGHAKEGGKPHAGLPSVRTLTPLLFRRLGITERKLARARKHGSDTWNRRRRRPLSLVAMREYRRDRRAAAAAASLESFQAAQLERLKPKP